MHVYAHTHVYVCMHLCVYVHVHVCVYNVCPRVLRCPLNATGWLVQATTLLEIATRLVDDVGHGFSYVL